MNERWMRIIDTGAPGSWFIALFITSYITSLLALGRRLKAMVMSLIGPVIAAPVFYFYVVFCHFVFDPFF
jgi:hypothetical protein